MQGHWTHHEVPMYCIVATACDQIELGLGFYALGDHHEFERVGKLNNGSRHRRIASALAGIDSEAAVKLDRRERQTRELRER